MIFYGQVYVPLTFNYAADFQHIEKKTIPKVIIEVKEKQFI